VRALLTEPDTKSAASAAGVSYATARRWLRSDDVLAALREAEYETLAHTKRAMLRLSLRGVDVLEEIMSDGANSASARVRAVDVLHSRLVALTEVLDLSERVAALESYL